MSHFTCPNCGYTEYDHTYQRTAVRVPTRQYAQHRVMSGGGDFATGVRVEEYISPTRPGAGEPDVFVPLLQAVVSGALSSVVIAAAAWFVPLPWYSPLVALPTITGAAWFYLLSDARRGLFQVERVEFSPQTAPMAAPTPTPQHSVKLEIEEDANHRRYGHLPLAYNELRTIAKSTVNNQRPFSLSSWAGSGKLLSRNQFESLRDWLLTSDYAQWADPQHRQQGIEWTAKGRAFWRALAV